MPSLADLQAQAADLTASLQERDAANPEHQLRRVNERLARFDLLRVRHSAGLELLNRIAEGAHAAGHREVLVNLCRTWWDAVLRESALALDHLPEPMAALTTALDDDAGDDTLRDFVAVRLLELERVLAT